jgi:heme/copper-type cytochrome/quinol oxidase subunit 3
VTAATSDDFEPLGVPVPRVAIWLVILSEVVIFGGLIACYILYRVRFPEWAQYAVHTSTPLGALNTLVLLTSSLTVVLAHAAAEKQELSKVTRYLGMTVALGLCFLVVKSIEYTTEIHHGFTFTANLFWTFYYSMTGLHAIHVILGMLAMSYVAIGASRGQNLHRVEMAGLYWHFVDVVWVFLFPLLYVAK